MATKKTEKTTSKKENASAREIKEPFRRKSMRILRDERMRFVIGLIVLFFSIFMAISFISFFFDGAADQSIIDYQSSKEMNSIGNGIQNWGGSHGAAFADFFIFTSLFSTFMSFMSSGSYTTMPCLAIP